MSNFIWDFTFIREEGLIGIFQPSSLPRKQRGMINALPPKTLLTETWNINGFRSNVCGNMKLKILLRTVILSALM